ncbi:MAG: DMT family transporter [Rhizobiaceae bacterium]
MPASNQSPASVLKGTSYGLAAVAIWAVYLSSTRLAVSTTLTPSDVILLRFSVAGLVMLPWVWANNPATLGGVGWWRGFALAAAVGPPFILVASAAFIYVPLAHGAVLQPSTAAMSSILAAIVLLREKVSASRIFGAAIIVTGITLIATSSHAIIGPEAWKGYVLSLMAGLCWATFTVLIRHWNIGGLHATAAASVISGAVVVPVFFMIDTFDRIAALPGETLVAQIVVQGLLAGVVAIVAYGRAIMHLGASGAALFPALVPATTMVVGIPVTGEWPTSIEWTGAIMATVGLMVAVGVFNRTKAQPV